MNTGVCMKDNKTGEVTQVAEDIKLSEAYILVSKLRRKQDGNWYWVGKAENHQLL